MNIQTASARDDHFHSHLLCLERSGALLVSK
jgi:hypothetical protein